MLIFLMVVFLFLGFGSIIWFFMDDDHELVAGVFIVIFFVSFFLCVAGVASDYKQKQQEVSISDKQIFDNFIGQKQEEVIKILGMASSAEEITSEIAICTYEMLPTEITTSTGNIKFTKQYHSLSFIINKGRVESWKIISYYPRGKKG